MKYLNRFTALHVVISVITLLIFSQGAQSACNANMKQTTPTAQFTVHGDGTVTDNKTGLMWAQCAQGQTASAGSCTGTASTFTWANALAESTPSASTVYSDWRVPNIKELESIVERACILPAINATVFPNTPIYRSGSFWSSSPHAAAASLAWQVEFVSGIARPADRVIDFQVRLVRGRQ